MCGFSWGFHGAFMGCSWVCMGFHRVFMEFSKALVEFLVCFWGVSGPCCGFPCGFHMGAVSGAHWLSMS